MALGYHLPPKPVRLTYTDRRVLERLNQLGLAEVLGNEKTKAVVA